MSYDYDELLADFIKHGARLISEEAKGALIEFMNHTIFIRRPMNGTHYDTDELRHNLANYRAITDGEIYTDYTHIFSFNGDD